MEDEETTPHGTPVASPCECMQAMAVLLTTEDGPAYWCLWCGFGAGPASVMLLAKGAPMPMVLDLDVTIPKYALLGRYDLWSPEC